MINAAIHSPDHKQLWATPGWLPQEIGVIVVNGQFYCYEGQDLKLHLQRGVYDITVYELVGVVADINSGENQKSHLVSMINGELRLIRLGGCLTNNIQWQFLAEKLRHPSGIFSTTSSYARQAPRKRCASTRIGNSLRL